MGFGMPVRITRLDVRQPRVSVAVAEVYVVAEVEGATGDMELRGKLDGPHCPGVDTVEIAYPFRPVIGSEPPAARCVIPEPNFWTAELPFAYNGAIELWSTGVLSDSKPIEVRFRTG
jgi:hypothetical protein